MRWNTWNISTQLDRSGHGVTSDMINIAFREAMDEQWKRDCRQWELEHEPVKPAGPLESESSPTKTPRNGTTMKCLLCATPLTNMFCPACHIAHEKHDNKLFIAKHEWESATRWREQNPMNLRDNLTIVVRDLAYKHLEGLQILPPECARVVFGLLLDLHCQLEGRIIALRKTIASMRPSYEYRPVPRRYLGGTRSR